MWRCLGLSRQGHQAKAMKVYLSVITLLPQNCFTFSMPQFTQMQSKWPPSLPQGIFWAG